MTVVKTQAHASGRDLLRRERVSLVENPTQMTGGAASHLVSRAEPRSGCTRSGSSGESQVTSFRGLDRIRNLIRRDPTCQVDHAASTIIRTAEELSALQAEWNSSLPNDTWNNPILCHLWAQTYVDVYGPGAGLAIAVIRKRGATAIAPLLRPRTRRHRLEFLSQREICEPMDFVYSDVSSLESLADIVSRLKYPLLLDRIPADSPALAALRRSLRRRAVVNIRPSWGCPWIKLDASWESPEQHVTARRRSDLRRARRRAEALGTVCAEIHAPTPAQLPPLLQEAFVVESASWKGTEGSALLKDSLQGEFYRRYTYAAAARGILRVCLLRIAGQPAAMQLALQADGRFWLLKIGYSDEFARCSPGILLMLETLRYASRQHLRAYEFLGNTEAWIRAWTTEARPCVSLRAYPFGVRGAIGLAIDVLAVARRRFGAMA
jgi:CelD/BcsL family acetyltransferase involved in cellulose biosynthesis